MINPSKDKEFMMKLPIIQKELSNRHIHIDEYTPLLRGDKSQ